jgi:hypothetical protein
MVNNATISMLRFTTNTLKLAVRAAKYFGLLIRNASVG